LSENVLTLFKTSYNK